MSDPFLGEIRAFAFTFAPSGWALCGGQLISLQQNAALYSLLGTSYGGNGTTNFGLPNLQNVSPMHWGAGPGLTPRVLGETLGETAVTVTTQEMPQHTHAIQSANATVAAQWTGVPGAGVFPGNSSQADAYIPTGTPNQQFSPTMIGPNIGSQPHDNTQPLQTQYFAIALSGVFPSRS